MSEVHSKARTKIRTFSGVEILSATSSEKTLRSEFLEQRC